MSIRFLKIVNYVLNGIFGVLAFIVGVLLFLLPFFILYKATFVNLVWVPVVLGIATFILVNIFFHYGVGFFPVFSFVVIGEVLVFIANKFGFTSIAEIIIFSFSGYVCLAIALGIGRFYLNGRVFEWGEDFFRLKGMFLVKLINKELRARGLAPVDSSKLDFYEMKIYFDLLSFLREGHSITDELYSELSTYHRFDMRYSEFEKNVYSEMKSVS